MSLSNELILEHSRKVDLLLNELQAGGSTISSQCSYHRPSNIQYGVLPLLGSQVKLAAGVSGIGSLTVILAAGASVTGTITVILGVPVGVTLFPSDIAYMKLSF